ncbi:MAG: B12-binding domain-containing radical SAM protein [Chloroflexi bacterium]|nr:B12-binding domain-containing radical SAM protein [Chloroflexota bacterium]
MSLTKVALIKPPATYADWYKWPTLGIGYISAYLKLNGIDCRIFDAYFNSWSEKETIAKVVEYSPDVIGLTAKTHEIVQAAQIAAQLKARLNVPTIVGGCHVTALPERTFGEFPVFDYGVCGEGEKTVVELLKFLQQDGMSEPPSIAGLAWRDAEGNIRINEPRGRMTSLELDMLPYPDVQDYYNGSQALTGKNSSYIMFTSRGCPYNCVFCMQVLGRQVRRRSAENIIQEMEYAIFHYGAHTFNFADEIFLFDNRETREVLQLMINRSVSKRIRWSALTRANFVNPELINLAKEAGCFRLEMGVESGDNGILKAINKGITVEQVRNAVRIIKDSGILVSTYYILGHPHETQETIKKTINLAVELNTDTIAVGLMVPYPGTKVYEMARQREGGYRLISEDWSQYDKYGGKALEVGELTFKRLSYWQAWAMVSFYLRNFRFLDLAKFFIQYRRGVLFLIEKFIARLRKRE